MTAGERLLRAAGPGILGGATFGEWLALLRANGFAVTPRCAARAAVITGLSLANSLAARREREPAGAVNAGDLPPPLFVVGLWRSGTTHLHSLLARDRRFAYLSLYAALNPHTFVGGGRRGAARLDRIVPRQRAMDRMRQGADEPVEEDVALAPAGASSLLGLVFPRSRDQYWRWVTLEGVTAAERARWRAAYVCLVTKLTAADGRPLVLKSPANTARVALLLEMFPDARFVNIHRHPCEVLVSSVHALNATSRWWRLQTGDFDEDWVVRAYGQVYDVWFRDRALIPAGRLAEVAFADLERDPVGELARVYAELGLPDFAATRDDIARYAATLRGYARNRYEPPGADTRRRLQERWARAFAEWGYQA